MVILISIGMVQCKSEKEKIKSKTLQEVKPGQSTADGKVSLTDDEMDHAKKSISKPVQDVMEHREMVQQALPYFQKNAH